MNKQELLDKGYTEEQATEIVKMYSDSIDGNYVTKTRFNEINEENKTLRTTVSERDTQIEELSKVDADELQDTITKLQEANQEKETEYQAELKRLKVKHAAERQINEAKALDLTSVLAHVDLSEVDLNDDGTVQGLKDKLESLKEEKSFLFEVEETEEDEKKDKKFKGAQPGQPKDKQPSGGLDPKDMTFEQFQEYVESQNN